MQFCNLLKKMTTGHYSMLIKSIQECRTQIAKYMYSGHSMSAIPHSGIICRVTWPLPSYVTSFFGFYAHLSVMSFDSYNQFL